MKKILVPIDGSDCSMRALDRARQLGELDAAEITLLTIVDSGRFIGLDFKQGMINTGIEMAEDLLKKATDFLGEYQYGVKSTHRVGDVADEIITMAEKEDFDLIVIGSRGLGTFKRAMLGGVSHKVISHADTSVMVVK